jgi:hypothetical protein
MTISLDKIAALAPDQGSVDAARKLLKPANWPKLEADTTGLVWGECQGSGATPYRVVITESDAGYKCTCPSRKFPCKHSLALMWLRAEGKVTFALADPPAWVKEWVLRRRGASTSSPAAETDPAKTAVSLSVSTQVPEDTPDPKTEIRAAAARERNRLDREASIRAGLDELDRWLEDQIAGGMAAFVAKSSAACRVIAQRMVDAKAPGLATRLDSLSARLFSLPESVRALAALEELGQLHLLAAAYQRQEELPPALRADIRQSVGWTVTRDALLEDPQAQRVEGIWRVVDVMSAVQPDKLRRIETWLLLEDGTRFALLLDFVPVATGAAASGYIVGERVEAELVFYPSATPLRALVVRSEGSQPNTDPLPVPDKKLGDAYAAYESALQLRPWTQEWPLIFRSGRVRRSGKPLFLCDALGGSEALPVAPSQWDLAGPLVGVSQFDGVAIWDGHYCTLSWADTELGRWVSA